MVGKKILACRSTGTFLEGLLGLLGVCGKGIGGIRSLRMRICVGRLEARIAMGLWVIC